MNDTEKLYDIICNWIDGCDRDIYDCDDCDRALEKRLLVRKFSYVDVLLEILRLKFDTIYVDKLNDVEKYMKELIKVGYDFYRPQNISGDYKKYLANCYYDLNFYKFLKIQNAVKIDFLAETFRKQQLGTINL